MFGRHTSQLETSGGCSATWYLGILFRLPALLCLPCYPYVRPFLLGDSLVRAASFSSKINGHPSVYRKGWQPQKPKNSLKGYRCLGTVPKTAKKMLTKKRPGCNFILLLKRGSAFASALFEKATEKSK